MMLQIPDVWREFLAEVRARPGVNMLYIFGASDCGKTSLCRFLTANLFLEFPTAYIDCDPGQSVIGPPTTIGLQVCHPRKTQEVNEWYHFVGSTSPMGHLLQAVTGVKKLAQMALTQGALKIILDSSGYVLGKPAQEFQFQLLDLLRPDFIVAIQNTGELEDLLLNFRSMRGLEIIRFPVFSGGAVKTRAERFRYREEKFRTYFRNATLHEIYWHHLGFHGMIPDFSREGNVSNRLIALCDAEQFVVTLGIVHSIHIHKKQLTYYAPQHPLKNVAAIQFGSIELNSDGSQLPPLFETNNCEPKSGQD